MTTETLDKRKKALEQLGLPKSAYASMARRAFRRLAFECHPDLHGGDETKTQRFRNLLEAYRTVCSNLAPPPGHTQTSPPAPSQGRDLHFRLRLDFLQAALGGEVCLRYAREAACPACRDIGEKEECAGYGGTRRAREETLLRVRVPAGVEDGEILRQRGEGDEGHSGGGPGDLHLLISARGHPTLKRRGLDIYSEVKLPGHRLKEGGPVRVLTVRGPERILIPPRSRPGKMYQLKGFGIARTSGGWAERGDHFVRLAAMESGPLTRSGALTRSAPSRAAAKPSAGGPITQSGPLKPAGIR
jgi:DnaJ-class molecular chaperone